MEKMVENALDRLRLTADLHHITHCARFHVVDVPANDLLAVIANHDLAKISAGGHPLHETDKPLQRREVIFGPDRIACAEFSEAVKQGFGIKFGGVQTGLGPTERI